MRKLEFHVPSLIPILCGCIFALVGLYIIFFGTPVPEYALVAWAGLFDDAIPVYLVFTFGIAVFNLVYVFLASRKYDRERAIMFNMAGVALAVIVFVGLR